MKKIWTLAPGEGWICDRMVAEWNGDNPAITVASPQYADVIWLLADWCWRQVPVQFLREKTVVTTVHHIVPEKFGPGELGDFRMRDQFTDHYHVYNPRTYEFIRPLTMKPITLIPYWANQRLFSSTLTRDEARQKYNIPIECRLIGSFQRDTEGHDLRSPKLEKGPDLLADAIIAMHARDPSIQVLLAGWRRQYVIGRLEQAGINFFYLERPPMSTIVELYRALDLYMVTARHEGGPQALIECGLMNVPTVSRPVGIAEQVLPHSAIHDDVTQAAPAIPNVKVWELPQGYKPYLEFFQEI